MLLSQLERLLLLYKVKGYGREVMRQLFANQGFVMTKPEIKAAVDALEVRLRREAYATDERGRANVPKTT